MNAVGNPFEKKNFMKNFYASNGDEDPATDKYNDVHNEDVLDLIIQTGSDYRITFPI